MKNVADNKVNTMTQRVENSEEEPIKMTFDQVKQNPMSTRNQDSNLTSWREKYQFKKTFNDNLKKKVGSFMTHR
jgi:hypothetical protein